ncbi:MAG TPA: 6-carboxytetrahydropterin synthase [Dehalococcoidia bacterium]|nr:6-carboxytetrahydropterin synthase [Dehalococcoidia bacterium]
MSYRIVLEGQTLRFASAHFTTFGAECEPLHGHNYALTVDLAGDLTPDSWVMDFSEAKAMLRALCKELDHKFILPLQNPALAITQSCGEFEVRFGSRRYVIPDADVAALPIINSTAELLAEWLAGRVETELAKRAVANVMSIRVGVEEMPGQSGWAERSIGR